MAKPPEPLNEVLPTAALVVEAEVVEVLQVEVKPAQPKVREGATSAGRAAPAQTVKLRVRRVLHGPKLAEVVAEKPEAGYALKAGNQGPFLLDAGNPRRILGRYGPDTWALQDVEKALTK